ncbi:PREDICTED: uncharacterized protein LOC106121878 [Papilio xuthus]|uniref:Uncharacterized protein LOC106121878 n=1 Tax=Papilio xuthus TaxID=66420 RepID=A0AAJ6ZIG1_PAPXU|nr:PREDICTED: uncharacterized protein LOC106121878 [Papilio xuthus]
MSKANPLSGLLANYGDSDDSDDEMVHASYGVPSKKINTSVPPVGQDPTPNFAGIHPAPIQHCPWSACYDESSGFTYYWNQQTNAVTWEAPPEYLLALKIAQQQLHCAGSAEVSAEEWQLYQQVLAEKQNTQNKMIAKAAINSLNKSSIIENPSLPVIDNKKPKTGKKRPTSDDEEEKIELITSYHNSDSESNDEAESPIKVQPIVPIIQQKPAVKVQKNVHKKQKIKPQVEYGPSMPPNLNYTVPIGPELPPNLEITPEPKPPERKVEIVAIEKEPEKKSPVSIDNEDSQDEISLLKKLKDKAKLLEKLGGELPSELQQIIKDETNLSSTASPSSVDKKNIDIDDMLEEIEKTEFLKTKPKEAKSSKSSVNNSPRSDGHRTPPLEELKTLFPSTKNHTDEPIPLFPSVANFEDTSNSKPPSPEQKPAPEKKENMYLMDVNEPIENVGRKKLRISNSVLPERKIEKSEPPAYTTKYSQYIEGFSDQRTGLGFKEEDKCDSPKNTINYGNGLTFTKGETLNEGKQEEDLQDLTDLIGAKLRYLNELQPCVVTPVQEMLIQLQTLVSGWECGGVCAGYVRRWAGGAGAALAHHEAEAAPPGWTCTFQRYAATTLPHLAPNLPPLSPNCPFSQCDSSTPYLYIACLTSVIYNKKLCFGNIVRGGFSVFNIMGIVYLSPLRVFVRVSCRRSEGRYRYRREADGLQQWEYPALDNTDMDISTTPPHTATLDTKEEAGPSQPPQPLPAPQAAPLSPPAPPSPPSPARATPPTPPPPRWHEPPPPGCDDTPPQPPVPEAKAEICEELMCFYNDIAELEKQAEPPAPAPAPSPPDRSSEARDRARERDKERDARAHRKKSKVKISTSMGMKHKSVSSLVAKWQQVADEIHSE